MAHFLKDKYLFILFGFLISGFFLIFSPVRGLVISQLYFTELNIEKSTLYAGEEVRGNFVVWNYEDSIIPDLSYRFKLFGKDEKGYFDVVMDDSPGGQNLNFFPGEKSRINFAYILPKNLFSDDYELRIQFFNSKGVPMVWEQVPITVERGEGKFLTLKNPWFLKDGRNLSINSDVSYNSTETPQIVFEVSNQSSLTVKARPEVTIYEYNVNENPMQKIRGDSIVLKGGEVQNQKFDLIRLERPGSYVSQLKMYDGNDDLISNSIYFYWLISGKEVEIVQVTTDKTSYDAGETVKGSVDIVVPEKSGEKGDLVIKITTKDGVVVGETKKEIDLKTGSFDITATTNQKVSNPVIETSIVSKENERLDRYEMEIVNKETTTEPAVSAPVDWKFLISLIVLFSAMIIALYFYRKEAKSKFNGIIFLFLITGGLFFHGHGTGTALAAVEVSSGPSGNTALAWSDPLPKYIYEAGGYTSFSGSIFTVSGPKFIEDYKVEFFIGDLSAPILKDYDTGGGVIKIIDEARSNIVKIGGFSSLKPVNGIDYKKVIKIPSDIPYLGQVRFYVQFKGYQPKTKKWHWIIAYQDAEIQTAKEGGLAINLTADKNAAEIDEVVTYNIEAANKSPCIRKKIDTVEILDRSGSMMGAKMADAISAAKIFISGMNPAYDAVGVVSYDSNSALNSPLTNDFSSVKSAIDAISAGASTCIACGISSANNEIIANRRPDAATYEILMTDGLANTKLDGGYSEPVAYDQTIEYAQKAKNNGIIIYTVGFGSDADDGLLKKVADITGGTYSFAPTGDKLKDVFEAIAGTFLGLSYGTKITIDIPEDAMAIESLDSRCSFNGDIITCGIGDLKCGDKTNISPFEIKLKIKPGVVDKSIINLGAVISNDSGKEKKSNSESVLISANKPPYKPKFLETDLEHCAFDAVSQVQKGTAVRLNWYYSDPDGDPQKAYEIWLDDDPDFLNKKFNLTMDSKVDSGSSLSYVLDLSRDKEGDWFDKLKWDRTYYWKVRSWDVVKLNPSAWSDVGSFEMPKHSYPEPDFDWDPKVPVADEVVVFNDMSKSFGGSAITDYLWTVTEGKYTFADKTKPDSISPHIKFGSRSSRIKLGITDDDGYFCESDEKQVNGDIGLPIWRPVPPLSP